MKTSPLPLLLLTAFLGAGTADAARTAAPAPLRVSENRRHLVTADGRPFFWLGDTAWELFHRLDRDEAVRYLESRQRLGFTVIQAVALAELDGLGEPNPYGHRPLLENDPTRPDVKPGPADDYWDHVDFIVAEANRRGLVMALLPTWGDKWNKARWGVGPEIFTPENARSYGAWIGRRYRDQAIVWVLGGDRPVENDQHRAIIRAMAAGLAEGDGGRHLQTFHPIGGRSSADHWPDEPWLDFHMLQSGHSPESLNFKLVERDYARIPVKPCLDGEPAYEYPPDAMPEKRPVGAGQVRRNAYWAVFAGAHGHTYGTHPIWQMFDDGTGPGGPGRKHKAHWDVVTPWHRALELPGASQLQHLRSLLLSRPFLSRIPDQAALLGPRADDLSRIQVTRDGTPGRDDATYLLAYYPQPGTATFATSRFAGQPLRAWWYNPRDGRAGPPQDLPAQPQTAFTTPDEGDWVLVVDAAPAGYRAPGSTPNGN